MKPTSLFYPLVLVLVLSGCASTELKEQNTSLQQQVTELESEQQQQQKAHEQEVKQLQRDYADKLRSAESMAEGEKLSMRNEMASMRRELSQVLSEKEALIKQVNDLTVIDLNQTLLFASGGVELTPEGKGVVRELASALVGYPGYHVRIEGHTDNLPLNEELKAQFISNWELSAMRASNVAKYLVYGLGSDKKHISIAGFADTRPVADNSTPQGRAENRRVRVVVFKELD